MPSCWVSRWWRGVCDLQAVWRHLRSREDIAPHDLTIIGDSGSAALATGTAFLHPHRVESRPPEAQVSGALLALLFALFEDEVTSVEANGGLVSFRSLLDSPFIQVPHCSCIPGVLQQGDLADVVAAFATRRVRLSRLVDGRNRLVNLSSVQAAYAAAVRAYSDAGQRDRLEFAEISADE